MKALSTAAFAVAFLAILLIPDASGVEVHVSPGTLVNVLRTASSNTTLYLNGTHHIDQFIPIYGLYDVSIMGEGGGDGMKAVITCADNVGLAFVNITNLIIMNVSIEGCGLTGQNLTETLALLDGVVEIFFKVPSEATIAVFLGHVENLTMQHAVVTNTSGLGLVGINVIGTSYISQVNFTFNIRPSNCTLSNDSSSITEVVTDPAARIGGGAYFLYQDYSPAHQNMYHDQQYSLNIDETNFIQNSECTFLVFVETNLRESRALQEVGYTIGGAGGLGLMLAQLHYGVDITTTSALIQGNSAVFGSGVHVGIFSGVRDSHVIFSNSIFIRNGIPSDALTTAGVFSVGGGGLAILNDLIRPEGVGNVNSFRNRNLVVNISTSIFTENNIPTGAGAYIRSEYTSPIRDTADALELNFSDCIFEGNSALLGSALEVIELKQNGRYVGMQVSLNNIVVRNNVVVPVNSGVSVSLSDNSAIMDIRSVNCTISGDSTISSNIGTAIHAEQSVIGIAGSVTFENNIGVYGGAIRLISYSYLIMTGGARLYLRENTGRVLGGALYVDFLGSQSSSLLVDDCFLYFTYDDFVICNNCSDLNSTGVYIEFSNNMAPYGSIVYGSALQQCPWAVPLHQQYENLTIFEVLDRHYPNVVNFGSSDPLGNQNVATSPVQLDIENEQTTYFVAPGEQLNVNVSAIDNFRQNIRTVVSSYAQSLDNTTVSIVGSNGYAPLIGQNASKVPIRIFGPPNQTLTVTLFSTGLSARSVQTQISLELGSCGSGFEYSSANYMCICSPLLLRENIQCVIANQTLIVPNNLWLGQVSGSGELAVSRCSSGYCQPGTRFVSVRNGSVDYDVQCDPDLNRVGLLCGSCPDGFSVVLGSNRCLECSNAYIPLFLIFALLGILLVFAISFLRITITAGYLNGALFYANIVALYGRILIPMDTSGGRYVLASFLTLNLGIETCLHSGLTPLERVWWQLSFPLYLFILMILTALLVRYCKCFQVSREAGLSTIQGFATLIIMCYVSVLESCVELLGPVDISTLNGENFKRWVSDPTMPYFQNAHGFMAFIACVLIVLYIIPLPFFLLFPSLVFRIKYLNRFKPFYDVFWNPFEPQFRFWLGLRLIFRWVPFILVYFADSPSNTYITSIFLVTLLFFQLMFKPFVGTGRNALDGYFLLNLIILISSSVYFNAVAESNSGTMREQVLQVQTATSTTIIVFGYLGFAVIFVYHIFDRFPKLKSASLHVIQRFKYNVRKEEEDQKTSGPNNTETGNEPPVEQSTDVDAQYSIKRTQPKIVTVTELREPLLDEGIAETVTSSLPFVMTGARDLTI